jgi:SulP family sulfate permease
VQAGTAEIMFTYFRDLEGLNRELMAIQILTQLTLLIGVVQVLAAACKLGRLTQFVSHSVVIGYITGTALAVLVNQLSSFLGIPSSTEGQSIYDRAFYLATHLGLIHWPTAVIGGACLMLLILLRRLDRAIPAPVITLVLAALAVHILANYPVTLISMGAEQKAIWQDVTLIGTIGNLNDLLPNLDHSNRLMLIESSKIYCLQFTTIIDPVFHKLRNRCFFQIKSDRNNDTNIESNVKTQKNTRQ